MIGNHRKPGPRTSGTWVLVLAAALGVAHAAAAANSPWRAPDPRPQAPATGLQLAALGDLIGVPAPDRLAPSTLVERIQELLQGLGLYRGTADGRLNDETVLAIQAYQRRSGLTDDGKPSEALIAHIDGDCKRLEAVQRGENAGATLAFPRIERTLES